MKLRSIPWLRALAVVLLTLGAVHSANGAPIVEYDVENANGGASDLVQVASLMAGISASPISVAGFPPDLPFGRGLTLPGSFAHEWTSAGALNPSQFLGFTLTPGIAPIQYGSLDVTVFETAGVPGTETFELHASLDGFNTSDITLATQDFARNGVMNAFTGVDISALGTQAGEVQFRMYFYNATGSPFFSGLITNNMVLHSVPEPSSALLVGCGLGGVVLVRRRWPGRAQSGPPAAVRR